MTTQSLSSRNPDWVKKARKVGDEGESNLYDMLESTLDSNKYKIVLKPRDLTRIYGKHGIIPDLCIINKENNCRIFIEKKTGNNGGNAHERAYKYLSPSLKEKVKANFKTPSEPFFFVFSGKTFDDYKYKEEISCLLAHIPNNYVILNDVDSTKICEMLISLLEK
jgi:hypothetical protein